MKLPPHKEAIRQVFPHAEFVDERDPKVASTKQAVEIANLHTLLVDGLRRHPNQRLATLGRNLWDVVHHRHIHTAMSGIVPSLSFLVAKRGGKMQGVILVPPRWSDQFTQQPVMLTGGVIFTGSQAVDYYNDRLLGAHGEGSMSRAEAYEAEFLKGCQNHHAFNKYQQTILAKHPLGFAPVHAYEYRPVAPEAS